VRVLWSARRWPAVSVTALQAATGAVDANFIELEGSLRGKHYGPDNTLVLDFDAGSEGVSDDREPRARRLFLQLREAE